MELAIRIQEREAARIFGPRILGFRQRCAVSTIIGGLIILTLILSALGTMVAVSRQYDQYQQTVNKMAQFESQQSSEKLAINSPGLTVVTTTTISGWGSGCTTTYNCYNMSLSNVGGVGVQIARIYINSTGPAGSGCSYSASSPNPQPCILNPTSTIAAYAFNEANQFVNPGEVNHAVLLALPNTAPNIVILPNPTPAVPQNAILIVTSRGNVFSFQWPVPLQVFGQSQSAFSTGIIKVAYQGAYNSANEPSFTGTTATATYCHTEPTQSYPAPSNYAEKLTGITGIGGKGVGVTGTTLYFVNPWVTETILGSAAVGNTTDISTSTYTQMYIYVNVINTGQVAYTPTSGSLDLGWYSANHLDGTLIGVYYKGKFTSTSNAISTGLSITPTTSYYAIYEITYEKLSNPPSSFAQDDLSSVMFWGDASITDWSTSNAENTGYFSATVLVSGFWIRYGC